MHIPDITHPTFYSTTSLQWYHGASRAPPFISCEPPLRTESLPEPPHGVVGNPDPAPDRVGPSQPPLNFVDGNGNIVLRGLVEARDCEGGWNKVMKAWGSGDEKVAPKILSCCSTPRGVKMRQGIQISRGVAKAKARLGRGLGGLFSMSPLLPMGQLALE